MRERVKSLFFSVAASSVMFAYPAFAGNDTPGQTAIDDAMKGDSYAQLHLGKWYESHHNYDEAFQWFCKAADQGNFPARYHLGVLYKNGQGVRKDDIQADMWLNLYLAEAKNDQAAIKYRSNLEKTMIPEQIAEGERLTREWMQQHPKPQLPIY